MKSKRELAVIRNIVASREAREREIARSGFLRNFYLVLGCLFAAAMFARFAYGDNWRTPLMMGFGCLANLMCAIHFKLRIDLFLAVGELIGTNQQDGNANAEQGGDGDA